MASSGTKPGRARTRGKFKSIVNRNQPTIGGWFSNQLWNTSLPWLLGLFFIGAGFYYTTTLRLAELDKKAVELQVTLTEQKQALVETKRSDASEREKTRDVFMADSKATALGIAELNKQTAVMATTLAGVQKELEKIGARLDAPLVPPRR